MIEVAYTIDTNSGFLEKMAQQFSEAYGEEVSVKDNSLVFPPALAKGRFEFHSIDPDIGFVLIDCEFYEEVSLHRKPHPINYFHTLNFNLSTIDIFVERNDYIPLHLDGSWGKKILYATTENGFTWILPKNGWVRTFAIYFTGAWLMRNYKTDSLARLIAHPEELISDQTLRFGLSLDIEILQELQHIFTARPPEYMNNLYSKGCVYGLIAAVAQRLIDGAAPEGSLKYKEVVLLLNIEKELRKKLEQPLPSLDYFAERCGMSKSKFEKLFKTIFGKSITIFFNNLRMQKAAELLQQGWKAHKAAQMVGFSKVSNFAKVFRDYYNISPKSYQLKMKENARNVQ